MVPGKANKKHPAQNMEIILPSKRLPGRVPPTLLTIAIRIYWNCKNFAKANFLNFLISLWTGRKIFHFISTLLNLPNSFYRTAKTTKIKKKRFTASIVLLIFVLSARSMVLILVMKCKQLRKLQIDLKKRTEKF